MKIKKVIIPAAGLGTRFLPATKAQPKEMLPIVDKPTIQYIVEEALASGIEDILIITGRNKRSIEDHFDKSVELEMELRKKNKLDLLSHMESISKAVNIHYVRQKEPLGLGHAIYCAKSFIGNEPFAVMLGDDIVKSNKPCLQQLIEIYNRYKTSVLGVQKVSPQEVSKYGIVDCKIIDQHVYKVDHLVEKPDIQEAPSNIAIMGRYIITPRIFNILEHLEPGKSGEIQLTDALKELNGMEAIYAYNFQGKRYDVGDKLGYLQATVEFALDREDLNEVFREYLKELVGDIKNINVKNTA
ncbi:UTP--glucose-1-phosphate uridylyltransferase [Anaerosolibacter carboniphilus]|uniref:UTP--glucose-1-phosphate uridylyltransferase n=1 Tax=Anaerosolibacter carboniphilus TaxID=1417629 RepID=A0A841KR18_9FIRM|nr:UTP--glucose-1-phosphate uridylyltransferase GalU [Anaerosolibacter carboniphilus]MBB6215946.1 UTP--glucose-1-phosphate uridylyltransferase [Anaerosolibacter carboniphilus]